MRRSSFGFQALPEVDPYHHWLRTESDWLVKVSDTVSIVFG